MTEQQPISTRQPRIFTARRVPSSEKIEQKKPKEKPIDYFEQGRNLAAAFTEPGEMIFLFHAIQKRFPGAEQEQVLRGYAQEKARTALESAMNSANDSELTRYRLKIQLKKFYPEQVDQELDFLTTTRENIARSLGETDDNYLFLDITGAKTLKNEDPLRVQCAILASQTIPASKADEKFPAYLDALENQTEAQLEYTQATQERRQILKQISQGLKL